MVQICKTLNAPISKSRKTSPQVQVAPGEKILRRISKKYQPFGTARGKMGGPGSLQERFVRREDAQGPARHQGGAARRKKAIPRRVGELVRQPRPARPPASEPGPGRCDQALHIGRGVTRRPGSLASVMGKFTEGPRLNTGRAGGVKLAVLRGAVPHPPFGRLRPGGRSAIAGPRQALVFRASGRRGRHPTRGAGNRGDGRCRRTVRTSEPSDGALCAGSCCVRVLGAGPVHQVPNAQGFRASGGVRHPVARARVSGFLEIPPRPRPPSGKLVRMRRLC